MKIVIAGAGTYKMDSIDKLTLKELLQLEIQSEALGRRLTMATVKAMSVGLEQCKTDEERENHPDAAMFFGVGIWIARRRAGEDISLSDALDFELDDLTILLEESDKKTDPTEARPGSGPGGKRPADRQRKTSKTASTNASSS